MTPALSSATEGLCVQVCSAAGVVDVEIRLTAPDVTLAEVFDELGLPHHSRVDGRVLGDPSATRALDVLAAGAQLCTPDAETTPAHDPATGAGVAVASVAGLDAGAAIELGAGLYRLNDFGIPDLGWYVNVETPPSLVNQPWHQSASTIEALDADDAFLVLGDSVDPEPGHSRAVHRPPRALPPSDVSPLELVAPPSQVQPAAPLSWATLLAPVPIAVMMAFFFRPIFALFAAMGPVMALGRWYESRRRHRRQSAERSTEVAAIQQLVAREAREQGEALARLRWLRHPHVAELWRRARSNSVRLWERRRGSSDFLTIAVGVGTDHVPPRTIGTFDAEVHGPVASTIELRPVPHTIDLAANTGLGIHGNRPDALAMSRAVVMQLATLHGPSDLAFGLVCDADAGSEWDWLKWLPHTNPKLIGHSATALAKQLAGLEHATGPRQARSLDDEEIDDLVRLVIVDHPNADVAAICRAAKAAGCTVRIVAVAADATSVPATCSSLIGVHDGGRAEIASPELTGRRATVCPIGISEQTATEWARSLTSLVDPEVDDVVANAGQQVGLLRVLDFAANEVSADAVMKRWATRAVDDAPVAVLGRDDEGVFCIDLTADGPHGLVAGTTGSGKSELLRTLVVSLAVACPPEHINFVLIDFKGGGAFDLVHRLPHVAGLITDLDQTLVERAVHSLRLELQRREALFRELGASEFVAAAKRANEPIARLVVVIDEFAALATDHAELMTAVIDLAARGRSLGMHLILATQRPSGVVDQKIRANTNLRIALRVQDAFDSQDVIGVADAAAIDRGSPGRAIVRVGADPATPIQTAFGGATDTTGARCIVRSHQLLDAARTQPGESHGGGAASDIDVLVDAVVEASSDHSQAARRLWSDPLPMTLDWIDLGARGLGVDRKHFDDGLLLGLADDPGHQVHLPWRWNPDSGALAIYGATASCTGKVLVSLGAALTSRADVDEAHVYVIDGDAGACAPLEDLPLVGAYVTLAEPDRIDRVVRMFEAELASRRSNRTGDGSPRLVMLIDNIASVLGLHDDTRAAALIDRLAALVRDGAPRRVHLVITARSVRDIGHRLSQQIPNRLALALSDPSAFLTLGLKASEVVPLPPMRAIDVVARCPVQLVEPPDLSGWPDATSPTKAVAPVGVFPSVVRRRDLGPPTQSSDGVLAIPVGIDADDLNPAILRLRSCEHALVAAGPGMGASSTTIMLVEQLTRLAGVSVLRVGSAASPLVSPDLPGRVVDSVAAIDAVPESDGLVVVVVDDADLVTGDMAAALSALIQRRDVLCHVIAASSLESARSIRAWTAPIRAGGTGIVLGGTPADGELFKARFTHFDRLGSLPGRGHLIVRGRPTQVQIARPHVPT